MDDSGWGTWGSCCGSCIGVCCLRWVWVGTRACRRGLPDAVRAGYATVGFLRRAGGTGSTSGTTGRSWSPGSAGAVAEGGPVFELGFQGIDHLLEAGVADLESPGHTDLFDDGLTGHLSRPGDGGASDGQQFLVSGIRWAAGASSRRTGLCRNRVGGLLFRVGMFPGLVVRPYALTAFSAALFRRARGEDGIGPGGGENDGGQGLGVAAIRTRPLCCSAVSAVTMRFCVASTSGTGTTTSGSPGNWSGSSPRPARRRSSSRCPPAGTAGVGTVATASVSTTWMPTTLCSLLTRCTGPPHRQARPRSHDPCRRGRGRSGSGACAAMSVRLGRDAHRAVVVAVLLEAGCFPGEIDLLPW